MDPHTGKLYNTLAEAKDAGVVDPVLIEGTMPMIRKVSNDVTDLIDEIADAIRDAQHGYYQQVHEREAARNVLAALSSAGWQIVRGEGLATGDELGYVAPVDVGCTDWCDDECEMNHYTEASWRRVGDR
jgi:hypothetical protein